jgi:hypothetical protein
MWTTPARPGRRASISGVAAVAAALLLVPRARGEDATEAPIIVYFADGSTVPLAAWSLSYEYDARPKGSAPAFGQSSRREVRDFRAGKKILSLAGAVLEVRYREYEEPRDVGGETQTAKVATATGFILTAEGKKRDLGLEAPDRDVLVAGPVEKGVQVRGLGIEVRGTTLTGAKRSFCLAGYVYDVQCHPEPAERVVKIEFPRAEP